MIAKDSNAKVSFQEPALVEAGNGDIVALMRTTNAEDHLYCSRSSDDGRTWLTALRTPLVGHPADLKLLPGGNLLAVYGYRHELFGVRACVSVDHGKSWDPKKEIVIAASGVHGDLGYPSACLTEDGHVVVAYYMNGKGTKDRWIECKRIPLSRFMR